MMQATAIRVESTHVKQVKIAPLTHFEGPGPRNSMYYSQGSPRITWRRGVAFVSVVILHLIFAYALYRGLDFSLKHVTEPPILIEQIDKPRARDMPTVPEVKVSQIRPYVPQPEYVDVNAPVETNAIQVQSVSVAPPAPTVQPGPVVRTGASVDPRNPLHIGEEYYPDASKRLGEEGACRVKLQVPASGRIADAQVVQSSGFPRLDDACLKGVIGQRMLPATEDGKAVDSETVIRIHWKLRKKW
jgi:protein TonB